MEKRYFQHFVFQANTIIPPPYSCMGSCEEVSIADSNIRNPNNEVTHELPRSASSISCSSNAAADTQQRPHQNQHSPSVHSQLSGIVVIPKSNILTVENKSNNVSVLNSAQSQVRQTFGLKNLDPTSIYRYL